MTKHDSTTPPPNKSAASPHPNHFTSRNGEAFDLAEACKASGDQSSLTNRLTASGESVADAAAIAGYAFACADGDKNALAALTPEQRGRLS